MNPKNIAMSVYQKLLNKARESGRPFNEILQHFAMERFLYRLSKSPHAGEFILKGALMLRVWKAPIARPTMDIDFLGKTANNFDSLTSIVRDVCLQEVEPDGVAFNPESIICAKIDSDAEYEGVRVRFRGNLGNARINMQLDIGFDDKVHPKEAVYPAILDLPEPLILGYTRESSIAEKFEAMVKLGLLNSRMKDFYDIWLLSQEYEFKGEDLSAAISSTFTNRGTTIEASPVIFSTEPGKSAQWNAFRKKSQLVNAPEDFSQVLAAIAGFLKPVAEALVKGEKFTGTWKASGPWVL